MLCKDAFVHSLERISALGGGAWESILTTESLIGLLHWGT
jgi:hypothetical protein